MDFAVSFARDHLLPYLMEVANMIRGVPKDVEDMKDGLQKIQALIHEVDTKAADEEGDTQDEIRTKVKQLIEIVYHMEDVIDEYMIHEEQQQLGNPRCAVLPCEPADFFKEMFLRFQIAKKIGDVKSLVRDINTKSSNEFQIQSFPGQGPSSSRGDQTVTWQHFQEDALYKEESDIVGLEAPREKLIGWLLKGREERIVISVVGMGGLGKTTLSGSVFRHKDVIQNFDCHAWITVSQSYTAEGLLRDMLQKFCKDRNESFPPNISTMDRNSLIDEVKSYLRQRRYVVFFDDVWHKCFWDDIKFALIDQKNGSRVFITTRDKDVAEYCKSYVEILEMQPLSEDKSWELFCKTAFQYKFDGCCPEYLKYISSKIVKKCNGLPLAIVAIGGLFSKKKKTSLEWEKFYQNLSLELKKNPHLAAVTKILGFSYNDLPYHLRSCFLYFGIYPDDFEVKSKRLIRQWIAEGFVKDEQGKTLEDVGKEYLEELVQRNLVQVSSLTIDDKVKGCRVHDVLHEMILTKFKDLKFCQWISADDQSIVGGIIRRMSIAINSNDLMEGIETSHVRSLLLFKDKELSENFVRRIPSKYMMLKLLDFENGRLNFIPEDWGNLVHLKYLSLRGTYVSSLPQSIVNLQNLETLDLRRTSVGSMPKEILELRRLQHLLADATRWCEFKDGIGGMTALQTLHRVCMPELELIIELEKLTQLRELRLSSVEEEHVCALRSSINKLQHLEKLYIGVNTEGGPADLDLHSILFPPKLRKLSLHGMLNKLPEWIPELQNLIKLTLSCSYLDEDPSKSLQHMENLLFLSIQNYAYGGESLHFQAGGFQNLKELKLDMLIKLNSIIIEKGALHSLKKFELKHIDQLKMVPSGIQHLKKLEILNIGFMPEKFAQSISPHGGQDYCIVQHVPQVIILRSKHISPWVYRAEGIQFGNKRC